MSRIAKNPVVVPKGVDVALSNGELSVKGPLGQVRRVINPAVSVTVEGGEIRFGQIEGAENTKALSGTMRALVANMVQGVTQGFERKLLLVGVGYKAQAQGDKLNLSLGFSHPVVHQMPEGIKVETPVQTEIRIKGVDKQLVGQVAAEVRAYRQPEPYKGKGVRYADEVVVIKETKKK
ncbi:MAG: 50S ribosomal protein L6 [Methyloversatilis sp.]|nr:50S ribosomal protein L6 [Methyloversatilis sp.]